MSEFVFRGLPMPDNLQQALDLYAATGCPTGGFLRACLANDLMDACARADQHNLPLLPVIAAYIYNELPQTCHGSYERIDAWIEAKRKLKEAGIC